MVYMVTWIPSIYPSHVSIYTSTMDPMGYILYLSVAIHWFPPVAGGRGAARHQILLWFRGLSGARDSATERPGRNDAEGRRRAVS